MANVSYPGVYVQEVSSGVHPITGASTSVAAFIGVAEKGPLEKAEKVFSFSEYQNIYGKFLSGGYCLSHAVYQFFNNGGTQCYVIRVLGSKSATATVTLNDRGEGANDAMHAAESLTIKAVNEGEWGNKLLVSISNGILNPGNEFNIAVYHQDDFAQSPAPKPREKFENLSMVSDAPNFVESVLSASRYIRAEVNTNNNNSINGKSLSGGPCPTALEFPRTKFNINIDGDGFQEVDLSTADNANLTTADGIRQAIVNVVGKLTPLKSSTLAGAFMITCSFEDKALALRSGTNTKNSSVQVAPANNRDQDASSTLKLGIQYGGVESTGTAVRRPLANPTTGKDKYSLLGVNPSSTQHVSTVALGANGDPLTDNDYSNAFQWLDDKDDVSLIAVPGIGSTDVVGEGMAYCANRPLSDCFFIADMTKDDTTDDLAKKFASGISPKNSYGAVYLPWVKMVDPTGQSSQPIDVPPSGYVAGLYAKTDAQRGVWKAPAGTSAALAGAAGLLKNFTDVEQGNLNVEPYNINVIRQFAGSGTVLWGARTLSSDSEWRYIPVRRTANFLRVSLYRGLQWAVFEPNDEELWSTIRMNIGSFMMTLYRQGAFQGSTPTEAFFVKCDKETTTQADINNGIVNVLVGFAPLKPAEFVVVKLSQKAGQNS